MIRQETVELDGVVIPVVINEGARYWPISYLSEKVLLRRKNSLIDKKQKEKYESCIKKYIVYFGDKNTQETNCISEKCLIQRLLETQQGRLTVDQRKSQNNLHRYLGIDLLSEKEHIISELNLHELEKHDEYTKDIIFEFLKLEQFNFQLCSSCEKYYPMATKFFLKDNRNPRGFGKVCHVCSGVMERFSHINNDKNKLIKQAGEDLFRHFAEGKLENIYDAYYTGRISFLPDCYTNKDSYLKIIDNLIKTNRLSVEKLSFNVLINDYGLHEIKKIYGGNINELHKDLFGEDYYHFPWKYPNIRVNKKGHTFSEAKEIFNKYCELNGFAIKDKFLFNYSEVINKARIRLQDSLGFIVYYHDYTDAGYKFKHKGVSYYKKAENVIFDMKYLIEQDMKLDTNKIPLYLTKTSLRERADPLYNFIVKNDNHNLYHWVNLIYPDKFTELDFDISYYREIFDSDQESQIHDILINNLENVVYNFKKNNKRLFTIKGMESDWIVIRENKCWLIEYFGLYSTRGAYNTRTADYVEKTEDKFKKYDELDYYGKIYLYPEDLKNNFEGVLEKIKIIK